MARASPQNFWFGADAVSGWESIVIAGCSPLYSIELNCPTIAGEPGTRKLGCAATVWHCYRL